MRHTFCEGTFPPGIINNGIQKAGRSKSELFAAENIFWMKIGEKKIRKFNRKTRSVDQNSQHTGNENKILKKIERKF